LTLDRESFRGIYVIVVTPFTEALQVDEDALGATVRFCIDAGVHGVVTTANASEVGYLSEAERRRVAEIVVREARGKTRSVVGVSSAHHLISAGFVSHAEEIGADAVMAMPPTFHTATTSEIKSFYSVLAGQTSLPIILQNAIGPGATVMSPRLMADIIADNPSIKFIKEETAYPAQMTGEVIELAGPGLLGVMGGRAGKTLMEEVPHGICGTMPACEIADVHVALWNAIENKDQVQARHIFRHILPLLDFEASYGIPLCKAVLQHRGVIPSSTWRQTGYRPLDRYALQEMEAILDGLSDWMLPAYRKCMA